MLNGRIRVEHHLDSVTRSEVLALAHAAGDADGADPLSEHVVLHLRHGGEAPAVHLLIRQQEPPDDQGGSGQRTATALIGYAHIDPTDTVAGASAELVVHPMHRRKGLGRSLVQAAMAVAEERAANGRTCGRLRLWAHGDHPSASALALTLGFERQRTLLHLRRSLDGPVPEPQLPVGVRLRAFRAGDDDLPWLALNAEAFADLPDQGQWTLADLHTRLAEPWFDPRGFLLAERISDGALVGFNWTKVHGTVRPAPQPDQGSPADSSASRPCLQDDQAHHAHDPIGEVYVLGVDPRFAGVGLGTALTLAGLRHLHEQGLDQAMLYVDQANPRAVALYEKLGFSRWSTDICFIRRILHR
ncbi:MAG: mycothiol synthase [Micromonosporaceae bacterium]|nr:mycothiol synthase [Micromonosporaceae bacterium]